METPGLYAMSDWLGVYFGILFAYVVLPSLLPALLALIIIKFKYAQGIRLFVPLSVLVVGGVVLSWFLLKADSPEYFVIAYVIPALIIDIAALGIAALIIKLVMKRQNGRR